MAQYDYLERTLVVRAAHREKRIVFDFDQFSDTHRNA